MKNKTILFLMMISPFVSSCHNSAIIIQETYFSHKRLPSYLLDTPDPQKFSKGKGTTLVLRWKLNKRKADVETDFLKVQVMFADLSIKDFHIPIHRKIGYQTINIPSEATVASYKAELFEDNKLTETWKHKLWAELIIIEEEEL
ncbi:hypothetical protein AB751O23_AB_00330 [Chlamydiales bacterium SCGC AB-751-O23]|jgi:hypothetical protein|nr:hypothetical protein AB751O23_AB_00330 [Chlamydiales bacterium SCGC AB-751-O23]